MTSEARWIRNQNRAISYIVRFQHPLFWFFNGFGPFPSAAKAGAALDLISARYPDAITALERARPEELAGWGEAVFDERYELAQLTLELALGEMLPFSVVETIALNKQELTVEDAQVVAAQAGCPVGEIVVMRGCSENGDAVWPVFRRHLDTDDQRKAETKALWLRREWAQAGRNSASIFITAYPFEVPAQG